jgi:hypothetical protein
LSFTITGLTVFFTSLTSAPLVTITVPGAMIFLPSGYCWVSESESLPVGTFSPRLQQKSLRACTAV